MGFVYLLALAISITGMVVLDRRFGLVLWADARRGAIVLAGGVAFLLLWDVVGIGAGVFFRGQTEFMTGLLIGPELPVEEVFFLTLLCYCAMNAYRGACLVLESRASGRSRAAEADRAEPRA